MELDRLLKLLVEKYIRSGKKTEKALESVSEKEKNAEMPDAVQENTRTEEDDVKKRNQAER